MKIGFSGFVLDQGKSGIATYVLELLAALSREDKVNEYDILVTQRDRPLLPSLSSNFHPHTFANWIGSPIPNILWHQVYANWFARRQGYEVLHIPTIRRIPMIKGCPIVATVHDLAPFVIPKKYDPLRMFYHRQILRRCLHNCNQLIAVSDTTKRDLVKWTDYPEDRIRVIYSGIDHELFRPLQKDEAHSYLEERYNLKAPFLVYVSRIEHPGKNHVNLLHAFEAFKRSYGSSHQLVIVGADWTGSDHVKTYVQHSPYKSDIHFLGYVPKDDIPRLYSGCDLMVYPSFYEGFGFPILEAFSCGAQVVCSRIPVFEEVALPYATLFDPNNPSEIASVLAQALKKPLSSEEREKQITYAATFTWSRTAHQVLETYQQASKR